TIRKAVAGAFLILFNSTDLKMEMQFLIWKFIITVVRGKLRGHNPKWMPPRYFCCYHPTKNSTSKGSFFVGQPVFAQLLRMIPRWEVQKSAKKFSADHYCKVFRTYEHLTVMLYAIFNKCTSLREVTTGIMACHSKLLHLGLDYTVRRSTLSDANHR